MPAKPRPLDNPKLFQLMAESVRDYAIFLLDPQGNIQSWNPGAERIKKYSADEIIGKHFSIFYTPEDIARGWCSRTSCATPWRRSATPPSC